MLEQLINYSGSCEVFNLGTGVGVSQKEIIEIVRKITGELSVQYVPSRSIDVPKIVLDNSRMKGLITFDCIAVKDGIEMYYRDIKEL